MVATDFAWGTAHRDRLRRARRNKGHNQEECGHALVELGAVIQPAQSTVSNWESGKTHRPPDLTIGAITIYCTDLEDPEVAGASESSQSQGSAGPRPHPGEGGPVSDDSFDNAVSELTGARPMNDRQGRFLDQMTQRLGSGPPMSDADGAVALAMLRALGLDG